MFFNFLDAAPEDQGLGHIGMTCDLPSLPQLLLHPNVSLPDIDACLLNVVMPFVQ